MTLATERAALTARCETLYQALVAAKNSAFELCKVNGNGYDYADATSPQYPRYSALFDLHFRQSSWYGRLSKKRVNRAELAEVSAAMDEIERLFAAVR